MNELFPPTSWWRLQYWLFDCSRTGPSSSGDPPPCWLLEMDMALTFIFLLRWDTNCWTAPFTAGLIWCLMCLVLVAVGVFGVSPDSLPPSPWFSAAELCCWWTKQVTVMKIIFITITTRPQVGLFQSEQMRWKKITKKDKMRINDAVIVHLFVVV